MPESADTRPARRREIALCAALFCGAGVVQHGREDSVVAIEQSKRLVSELQEHGVPHVARFDKDEGHGTFHFENRVELYSEIEALLAKYLAK